ncbi:MAG: hypothetical protein ACYSTF_01340, partial [Planctomycetota bacterium]
TRKNLLVVTAGLACCIVVVWLSTLSEGGEKTYELRPEVMLPEYRTDTARAIDAYERLMERYMDLTEMNMVRIGMDVQAFGRKLDSIDSKQVELLTRISRIERALGIEEPTKPVDETPDAKEPGRPKGPNLEGRR